MKKFQGIQSHNGVFNPNSVSKFGRGLSLINFLSFTYLSASLRHLGKSHNGLSIRFSWIIQRHSLDTITLKSGHPDNQDLSRQPLERRVHWTLRRKASTPSDFTAPGKMMSQSAFSCGKTKNLGMIRQKIRPYGVNRTQTQRHR